MDLNSGKSTTQKKNNGKNTMMNYDDLSEEQKQIIHAFEVYQRQNAATLLRMVQRLDLNTWVDYINDQVVPILVQMNDAAVVPNTTSLPNAVDLTVQQLKLLRVAVDELVAKQQESNSLMVKAGGTGNV